MTINDIELDNPLNKDGSSINDSAYFGNNKNTFSLNPEKNETPKSSSYAKIDGITGTVLDLPKSEEKSFSPIINLNIENTIPKIVLDSTKIDLPNISPINIEKSTPNIVLDFPKIDLPSISPINIQETQKIINDIGSTISTYLNTSTLVNSINSINSIKNEYSPLLNNESNLLNTINTIGDFKITENLNNLNTSSDKINIFSNNSNLINKAQTTNKLDAIYKMESNSPSLQVDYLPVNIPITKPDLPKVSQDTVQSVTPISKSNEENKGSEKVINITEVTDRQTNITNNEKNMAPIQAYVDLSELIAPLRRMELLLANTLEVKIINPN